jgi:hypothetical protein
MLRTLRIETRLVRGDRTAVLEPHVAGLIRLLARLAARDEITALAAEARESIG